MASREQSIIRLCTKGSGRDPEGQLCFNIPALPNSNLHEKKGPLADLAPLAVPCSGSTCRRTPTAPSSKACARPQT